MAPSPTAEATRLMEPRRTSPATNTPGSLDSSGSGARSSGHAVVGVALQVGPGHQESLPVAAQPALDAGGHRLAADQHVHRLGAKVFFGAGAVMGRHGDGVQ